MVLTQHAFDVVLQGHPAFASETHVRRLLVGDVGSHVVALDVVVGHPEVVLDHVLGLAARRVRTQTLAPEALALCVVAHVLPSVVVVLAVVHLPQHLDLLVLARYHLVLLGRQGRLWCGQLGRVLVLELGLLGDGLADHLVVKPVVLRAWPQVFLCKVGVDLDTDAVVPGGMRRLGLLLLRGKALLDRADVLDVDLWTLLQESQSFLVSYVGLLAVKDLLAQIVDFDLAKLDVNDILCETLVLRLSLGVALGLRLQHRWLDVESVTDGLEELSAGALGV